MYFQGSAYPLCPTVIAINRKLDFSIYGDSYICAQLDKLRASYWLVTVDGADHIMSGRPGQVSKWDMLSFYDRLVKGKEPVAIRTTKSYYQDTPGMKTMLKEYPWLKENPNFRAFLQLASGPNSGWEIIPVPYDCNTSHFYNCGIVEGGIFATEDVA